MDVAYPKANTQPMTLRFSAFQEAICLRLKSVMNVYAMQNDALPFGIQTNALGEQVEQDCRIEPP
jgi:hypothetical protein